MRFLLTIMALAAVASAETVWCNKGTAGNGKCEPEFHTFCVLPQTHILKVKRSWQAVVYSYQRRRIHKQEDPSKRRLQPFELTELWCRDSWNWWDD